VAFDGTVTICQPLIAPLYEQCRSALELVAVMTGQLDRKPYDIVREFWTRAWEQRGRGPFGSLQKADGGEYASFEAFWRESVHDGFVAGTALPARSVTLSPSAIGPAADTTRKGLESRSARTPASTMGGLPTTAGSRNFRSRSRRSSGTTWPW